MTDGNHKDRTYNRHIYHFDYLQNQSESMLTNRNIMRTYPSDKRLKDGNGTTSNYRHVASLCLAKEDSHNGQRHLQFTVIAQDALSPREEDLLKRYRPDNGDDRMA